VAPAGGRQPVFGANPLAAAIPVGSRPPILIDFATSVVSSGKLRVARDAGEPIPEGWILDRDGRPSRRPQDYYDGGMPLPAAGHKGSALSLLIDVLSGLLTGGGTRMTPSSDHELGNGVFFLLIDIGAFRPLTEFTLQVQMLGGLITATPPTMEGGEVLPPAEPEQSMKAARLANGIDIPETTWSGLQDAASCVGIELAADLW